MSEEKKQILIDRIAAYVMSHHRVIKEYSTEKMEAADTGLRAALKLFLNDPSAASDFLEAIGSDFDVVVKTDFAWVLKDENGLNIGNVALRTDDIPNNIMNGVKEYDLGWSVTESNTGNKFHHFIFVESEPEDD